MDDKPNQKLWAGLIIGSFSASLTRALDGGWRIKGNDKVTRLCFKTLEGEVIAIVIGSFLFRAGRSHVAYKELND